MRCNGPSRHSPPANRLRSCGRLGNDPRSLLPEREQNPENVPSRFSPSCRNNNDEAAEIGFNYALEHTNKLEELSRPSSPRKLGDAKNIAKISSVAAAIAVASGNNPATAAFGAIFLLIGKTLPNQLRFDTGGRYCIVHLLDIGQPIWPQSNQIYADAAIGQIHNGGESGDSAWRKPDPDDAGARGRRGRDSLEQRGRSDSRSLPFSAIFRLVIQLRGLARDRQ